jgi:photosystem II stability/assembly factor-like uncharacterized protein
MKKLLLSTFAFCLFTFVLSVDRQAFAQQYGWTDLSANVPGNPDFSGVYFVSDNEGWMSVSSGPEIYHTTDGGATFEIQETSLGTATEAIYMTDENEGYTGGGSGFVYRTTNGGINWDFLGAIPSTLSGLDFANSTQGYACGDNGAVFSVTPEGVTNLNSGLASNLYDISAPSVNNVWVCGGGTISHYNGTGFEFQSGPVGSYNSIFFINDNEGWVVGNVGLIGYTEDGGDNWHRQINSDDNSIYSVFFYDENDGWAVGFQGIILKTTNGGDTWTVDEEGSALAGTNFLRGIYFTSPTNGYVIGNGKTLLKYGELSGTGSTIAEKLQFEIYPNPASEKLRVAGCGLRVDAVTVELFDLNGRKLLENYFPAGNETTEIDVSHLQNGVYFCRLIVDEKNTIKKLIIQK